MHRMSIEEHCAALSQIQINRRVLVGDVAAQSKRVHILQHCFLSLDFLDIEQALMRRTRVYVQAAIFFRYIGESHPSRREFPRWRIDELVVLVRLESRCSRLAVKELRLYSGYFVAENLPQNASNARVPKDPQEH